MQSNEAKNITLEEEAVDMKVGSDRYNQNGWHPDLLLQQMIIRHVRQVCISASLVRYWARSYCSTSASSSCSALRLRSRAGSSGISVSFQTRKKWTEVKSGSPLMI